MKKLGKPQLLVVVATLFTILVNILADALPLNGQTTAEVSNQFDSYFVPAGYVFSIWGIIYLGLLAFAWYQSRLDQAANSRLTRISSLYIASCAANIAWLFFWHYNLFILTLIAMIALLVLLILIYQKLQTGKSNAPTIEKWVVDTPFELYLGWICIATIANVADVLSYYHWDGFGVAPLTWASIMLTAGVLLAIIIYLSLKNLVIPIVFIWAYIGIGVKFSEFRQYSLSAWVMAILIAFMIFSLDLGKKIKAGSEIPPPG
jgi:translocator protein